MTSTSALGVTQIMVDVHARPEHRRRRAGRPGRHREDGAAAAARACRRRRSTRRSIRRTSPSSSWRSRSPTLPLYTVDEYAQTFLAQRISTISGVAQVTVFGSQKYAVRVQVDPRALVTRGIGIDEVEQAASRAGTSTSRPGILSGPHQTVNVQATGQLMDADAYRPLVVAYRNGSPVRLDELGRVIDGVQSDKVAGLVQRRARGRPRRPAAARHEHDPDRRLDPQLLPSLRQQLPASVNLNVVYDRSVAIRESVHDVQFTLVLTIALVVMVIFLFLRNVSATIIPSLAVPLSIVGHVRRDVPVRVLRSNIISLMALTLCVGFVVDDAVVVLENIVRHMEAGKTRMEAALNGAREIGFTILSMTLSLAAVFIPVLFMGGLVGRLLQRVRGHDHGGGPRVGRGVADAHADALQPVPAAPARRPQPALPVVGARLRRHAARLRPDAAVVAPAPPADDGGVPPHVRGHRLVLPRDPDGLHPHRGQRHASSRSRRRRRTSRSTRWRSASAPSRRSCGSTRTSSSSCRSSAPRGSSTVLNNGRDLRAAEAARRAAATPNGSSRTCARSSRRSRGCASIRRSSRRSASASSRRRSTSTRCRARTRRSSITGRRSLLRAAARLPGLQDVNTRSADHEPADHGRHRPRQGLRARRHRRPDRERARGGVRLEAGLDDLHAVEPVLGDPRGRSAVTSGTRTALQLPLHPLESWARSCRSTRSRGSTPGVGPLTVNHLGQLPAVTLSFNTRPGVSLSEAVAQVEAVQRELRVPAT